MIHCDLCNNDVDINSKCPHPKNGYCTVYNLEAKQDALTVKMHPSIHSKKLLEAALDAVK